MVRRSTTRLFLRALETRIAPSVFNVLNTADSGAGSLRQAIVDANSVIGSDSVVFDTNAFSSPTNIVLTTGQITISDAVAIGSKSKQFKSRNS